MATFTGAIGTGIKWLLDKIVGVLAATGVNPFTGEGTTS